MGKSSNDQKTIHEIYTMFGFALTFDDYDIGKFQYRGDIYIAGKVSIKMMECKGARSGNVVGQYVLKGISQLFENYLSLSSAERKLVIPMLVVSIDAILDRNSFPNNKPANSWVISAIAAKAAKDPTYKTISPKDTTLFGEMMSKLEVVKQTWNTDSPGFISEKNRIEGEISAKFGSPKHISRTVFSKLESYYSIPNKERIISKRIVSDVNLFTTNINAVISGLPTHFNMNEQLDVEKVIDEVYSVEVHDNDTEIKRYYNNCGTISNALHKRIIDKLKEKYE